MGFYVGEATKRWPWLYHNTDSRNLGRIGRVRRIESVLALLSLAGPEWVQRYARVRRPTIVILVLGDGERVHLRDHKPMALKGVRFESGFDEGDFVGMLNERVFFWPGNEDGPIEAGQGLGRVYARQVTIRVPFDALLAAPSNGTPEFSRVNSGATRPQPGGVSRGRSTFSTSESALFPVGQVKEVTFVGGVALPVTAQLGKPGSRSWSPL